MFRTLVHHPGSSVRLFVCYFTTESFLSTCVFPFYILHDVCASPFHFAPRRARRSYDGNSYGRKNIRSTGSEPSGDVSISFLFFSPRFFGTFHRRRALTLSASDRGINSNSKNFVNCSIFKRSNLLRYRNILCQI